MITSSVCEVCLCEEPRLECEPLTVITMTTYISVAEEEGAEPIELPTEDDGTGRHAVHEYYTVHAGVNVKKLELY